MAFKLFTQAQAREIGMRIINGYKQSHNIPIVGTGIVLATTPKRTANKLRQAQHRTTHTRMTVWDNADNAAILAPVKIKLQAIRVARKNYNHALSLLGKAQLKSNYNIANGLNNTEQAAQVAVLTADVAAKLIILNTAKAA